MSVEMLVKTQSVDRLPSLGIILRLCGGFMVNSSLLEKLVLRKEDQGEEMNRGSICFVITKGHLQ